MDGIMMDEGGDTDGSHEVLIIKRKAVDERDETVVNLGWRIYGLMILTILSVIKSVQEYLLIVTISGMADELKFGETECQVINDTGSRDYLRGLNMTGEELCSEDGRCSENSTLFLPDVCGRRYTGRGTHYDILAGPIYLIIEGISTVPLISLVQGFSMREQTSISMFAVLSTLCSLLTAFVNDYWAVALLRFLFGIFSGAHSPLVLAYLMKIFPKEVHAIVLGFVTYGTNLGYGISYLFVYITQSIGWRWCYIISGSAGLILALLCCFMANPKRSEYQDKNHNMGRSFKLHQSSWRQIAWPCMMCVILANTGRTSAIYVGSYNLPVYVAAYFPEFNVAVIGWITIIISLPATIFGGWMGDRLRKVSGVRVRICLCLVLQLLALVFAVSMYQSPLLALLILFAVVLFMGDWIFVTMLSIISDLTPFECKAFLFSIHFFFTHSIVGTVNLGVTPVASATSLRTAITLLCGILSGISAFFLLLPLLCSLVPDTEPTQMTNRNENHKFPDKEGEVNEKTPLRISYDDKEGGHAVYSGT